MKKTVLASLIAAAAVSAQAYAVEIYNSGDSTFSIGGHVTASVTGSEDDDTIVDTVSPRINFNATQDIGHGYTADAKGEWQLNLLNGGENSFTTRLGYVGVTHDRWGRVVAGTQWSPYYDVGGLADLPIVYANDFLYENHKELGTARADRMLSYRNSFEFGDGIMINGGLGWQGEDTDDDTNFGEDDRFQVALSVTFAGFKVGYAYTGGDYSSAEVDDEDANSHIVAAKYGSYGDGLFLAGVYGMNEYVDNSRNIAASGDDGDRLEESNVYEAVAAYGMGNGLNLIINYEALENDKESDMVYSQMALQAEYSFTSRFIGILAYQFDLGGDGVYDYDEDDEWTIAARYYL